MPTSGTEVVIDAVSDARVSGLSMAERADLLRTGKCRTGTDVTMKIADAKAAEIRTAWGKFARKPAGVVCSSETAEGQQDGKINHIRFNNFTHFNRAKQLDKAVREWGGELGGG